MIIFNLKKEQRYVYPTIPNFRC